MFRLFEYALPPRLLAALLLLAGTAIRLRVYLEERSLFLDEANLSRNIAGRDWGGLLQPLDYQQYAPPGYLALVKAATRLLGNGEYGLRFVALLSGIGLLLLVAALSRRLIRRPWPRLLPLFLIAFSYDMVRYGTENKQYAFDTLLTALLAWLALRQPPHLLKRRGLLRWALIGAAAVWCSMPAAFTLAGVGLYYALGVWQARDFRKLAGLLAVAAAWLFSFGFYYLHLLQPEIKSDYLNDYHQAYFLPLWPQTAADWQQLGALLLSLLRTAAGATAAAYLVAGAALLWGLRVQGCRSLPVLLLLALPVLCCLLASGLEQYSLMPRLTLFFIPLLVLLMGIATDDLWPGRPWMPALLLLLWLPVLSLQKGWQHLFTPLEIENTREALRAAQAAPSGDLVYVHHAAVPAAVYYRDYHPQRAAFQRKPYFLAAWNEPPSALRDQMPPVFWTVYSHLISEAAREERRRQTAALQDWAVPLQAVETTGARATQWKAPKR